MIDFIKNILNPLFYNVLYMSVIGIVVGIFILVFRKILDKKISPKWKWIMWSLLLVSLVIPFKFKIKTDNENMQTLTISGLASPIKNVYNDSSELYYNQESIEIKEISSKLNVNENNYENEVMKDVESEIDYKDITLHIIIPVIWSLGIGIGLLLLILGNRNISKKIKGKEYKNEEINDVLKECKEVIGINKNIKIILQNFKKTPSIIGIVNPKILVTEEFLKQDSKTKKYIIMHELSHYKRKDLLYNYILLLVTILHWFNPFIWIYFKKIRQDIELATDELVLNKLKKDEKKEYGLTLINSLNIFQEEKYTAKLLCVTDDSKNMERRVRMIKLSDKFSKNKILIAIISIIIIIVGAIFFFTQTIYNNENQNSLIAEEDKAQYKFKSFRPSFQDENGQNYDFTHDMTWKDGIYHRKINDYEEYSKVKARWNDILDMEEKDFEENFMLITAVENTSMVGLTVDNVEAYNDGLYVSLIHYEDGVTFDDHETAISYIIPRTMERDNIYVTRNYLDSEKDMSPEMQIGELNRSDNKLSDLQYRYKEEKYRNLLKRIEDNPDSSIKVQPENWKDMMYQRFEITKDMPDIDFSTWNQLGDNIYSLPITKHSDYLKLMNYYNAPKLLFLEFKYIYPIVIVDKNLSHKIGVSDIDKLQSGRAELKIYDDYGYNPTEDTKYQAVVLFIPNYRSLEQYSLNLRYIPISQNNTELNITTSFTNEESSHYRGRVKEISGNTITFENYNHKIYKIDYDDEIELLDGRTEETIKFDTIKVNDLIELGGINGKKYILISTPKEGEELKKDLIKNMSLGINKKMSIASSPNIVNLNIINSNRAIMTIEFYDIYSQYFNNDEKFTMDVLLDSNTIIRSKSGLAHSIDTLNDALHDIITMYLDPNTLNDKYPRVTMFTSSDT